MAPYYQQINFFGSEQNYWTKIVKSNTSD